METHNRSARTGETAPTPDPKNTGVTSPEGIEAGNIPAEIEALPSGQMVVSPANLPAPTRQSLVWLRVLLKNPKALVL